MTSFVVTAQPKTGSRFASCSLTALLWLIAPAMAEPISPSSIRVIDGDTIHVAGRGENTRLVGFNAPETRGQICMAERTLGTRATARLRSLVTLGDLDLSFAACACPRGTELTDRCNYGRSCAVLRSRGRDVGDILIAEGLAVPFVCGETSCPKTPRPWCE